jgi:hypothetical protein
MIVKWLQPNWLLMDGYLALLDHGAGVVGCKIKEGVNKY